MSFVVEGVHVYKVADNVKVLHSSLYHMEIAHDAEKQQITASVMDYTGVPHSEFSDMIEFEYDTHSVSVPATEGKATIDFQVTASGEHKVYAKAKGVQVGEVTIHV